LLPNSESALLLNLLKALEQEKKEPVHNLGIESYGISMTSLEDVFLKITADENEHSDEPKPSLRLGEQSIDVDEDEPDHIVGSAAALDAAEDTKQSSFVTKMNALVKARVIFQMRSWKMLLVFLLLPTLTLLLMNVIFTAQQRLNGNQLDSKTDAVPESFSFVEYLPFTLPFYETFNRNQISTFINATHSLSPDPNGIKFLEFSSSRFIEEYLTDLLNSTNNATIDPEFGFGALAFFGMNTTSDYYIINFYYNQVRHGSLPALINMFHSAVLAIHAGPEVAKTYLKVNSNPFPQASGNILLVIRESTNAYVIALELCALGVLLAKKVLSERLHQTRLLINVTGTPPFIYWISNLIVDGTLTFISVFMACVIGFIVQLGGLTPDLLPSIALIAVGFTLSYTSWAYVCTFMFNKVETLQKWLGLINMVTLLPSGLIFLPAPYNILSNLTPPSAVATAFVHLANLKDQSRVFNQENYLAFLDPNLGICWTLLFFLGQSLFFFSILVIVDSLHNYHKRQSLYDDALPPRDDIDMDDDVRVEKDRVWNDQHNPKDVVKALNIYKVYNKDVTAVKGVTLGIQNNICFGLLGPNGAGKTTTIAMLTAQTSTSHGDILLHNMSTHNISVSKLYRQIALNCCLQSNKALMGFLTVREQLELYVKLRAGLTSAQVSHHVTSLLHRTGLSKYEKKLTKTLSGGNKRKLSLAIAMAWGSKIILLDEPSSGMDPLARRQLWHEIRYVKNNNTCVLLTTHSMDEAEAICDRIAIMVKGQIRCIGSPQHLKHKFGSGYRLLLTYSQDKQLEIHNFVTSHFAGCKLLEAMDGFRMYDVGAVGNNLAGLFALVEENKQALSISNWAISQTSLKQVFLHLTKQQNEQPLFS
jgi:ATP-binding cassette subfamily A (ABC1) protein 3